MLTATGIRGNRSGTARSKLVRVVKCRNAVLFWLRHFWKRGPHLHGGAALGLGDCRGERTSVRVLRSETILIAILCILQRARTWPSLQAVSLAILGGTVRERDAAALRGEPAAISGVWRVPRGAGMCIWISPCSNGGRPDRFRSPSASASAALQQAQIGPQGSRLA